MENQRDHKAPRLKSLDGVVSPINMLNLAYGRRCSSIFDPYASDSSNSPSPLMKYLCSADPTSDSTPPFITPVKVEEDVIVMDGIPVPKSNKGCGEVRMRLPLTSSSSINSSFVGGRSNSTSSPSSGGGGRSSGTENTKHYRNRLCRFWETCGTCQFGTECLFAHGKEELRPPRSSGKIKPEIFKSNNSLEGSSLSSSYGTNYPPTSQIKASTEELFPVASVPTRMAAFSTSPVQVKQFSANTTSLPRSDWTPQDDGIEVTLPTEEEKNPSKEDVDAYIEKVLSGTNSRKRLPVFVEICPD
ncbi:hypothetical protein DH2020_011134 [Rehmannia glutinosa]|uniref:C3H1-type domain-containing protein n=1 Tax=Rehmannia glutinosa TaxID=99300 RepID=A0ABR0XD89_REHGL